MTHSAAVAAVSVVALATTVAGTLGMRRARTTGDFYVASRAITPRWNAAAIGGEYLSAASFLGVAGLILAYGYDVLWYPVCYTAGYLILLVLVAAPLRRSGAYTVPDFAEMRLGSPAVRRAASVLVVLIGWLYLVPQLQGAGLTLATQTGGPRWLGGLVVWAVVLVAVGGGGMRSITMAQAGQYLVKMLALLIPALVLIGVWHHSGDHLGTGYPTTPRATTVQLTTDTTLRFPVAETVQVHGRLDGAPVDGALVVPSGVHSLTAGTRLVLPRGAVVPVDTELPEQSTGSWLQPLGSGTDHPLYVTLSLIVAICLGTMGLPHVVVRFYTNPDGRDTRRTALIVIVLLSSFYLLPTVFGVLGRHVAPDLLLTGNTDATVLVLPERMVGGTPGVLLGALVTAGAFAAFLSTASGLTVSVAGVLSQGVLSRDVVPRDVLPRDVLPRDGLAVDGLAVDGLAVDGLAVDGLAVDGRRRGTMSGLRTRRGGARVQRIRSFRRSAVVAISVPYLLSLTTERLGLAVVVGLAFAVAAATFCPLLVLGIWWPRLTDAGALTGLVLGGVAAVSAVLATLDGAARTGWLGALLDQPAAWAVPLTVVAMVVVSLATPSRVPLSTLPVMVRLHAPEALVRDLARLDRSSRGADRSSQPVSRSASDQAHPATGG